MFRTQQGFSITNVVVAMGIASVGMLALTKMSVSTKKAGSLAAASVEFSTLQADFQRRIETTADAYPNRKIRLKGTDSSDIDGADFAADTPDTDPVEDADSLGEIDLSKIILDPDGIDSNGDEEILLQLGTVVGSSYSISRIQFAYRERLDPAPPGAPFKDSGELFIWAINNNDVKKLNLDLDGPSNFVQFDADNMATLTTYPLHNRNRPIRLLFTTEADNSTVIEGSGRAISSTCTNESDAQTGSATASVQCSAGYRVLNGGCQSPSGDSVVDSFPSAVDTWSCKIDNAGGDVTATANCCVF